MRATTPKSTSSSATWSDVAGDVEIHIVSREAHRDIVANVIHAGRGEWGPGDRYERIRKKSYSLELVVGGSGVMDINGVRHELWPGDLVFMHPEDACVYWTGPKGVWQKLFVALHDRSLRPLVRQLRLEMVWHVRLTRAGALRAQRLMTAILRMARQAAADAPFRASVCAYELLLLLAGAAHRIEGRAHLPPQLQRALDAAFAPGSAIRNVTGMARAARCPPEYFSKLFHRHMGLPPHEWLTRARMEQAADLLRTTDQPVHEVGASAGYPDPFHFSRVFRRFAGVSPRGYRAQSWRH